LVPVRAAGGQQIKILLAFIISWLKTRPMTIIFQGGIKKMENVLMSESVSDYIDPRIACGMYWERKDIEWGNPIELKGENVLKPQQVDLAGQQGFGLLYRNGKLILFDQITEPMNLGSWLYEMKDIPWDKFSFLGLREVRPNSTLGGIIDYLSYGRVAALGFALLGLASFDCIGAVRSIKPAKFDFYDQVTG